MNAALADAAQALVGTPFLLHGRDPATGVDCVGLVLAAMATSGRVAQVPTNYGLANRSVDAVLPFAEQGGWHLCEGPARPGDLVLTRPGPARFHLLIARDESSFIHADAALGRVVRIAAPLRWPIIRHWRLS